MLKSYASAPFLAGLLHLLLPEAQAGIRTGVSINGTTEGPNYIRAEGKRECTRFQTKNINPATIPFF